MVGRRRGVLLTACFLTTMQFMALALVLVNPNPSATDVGWTIFICAMAAVPNTLFIKQVVRVRSAPLIAISCGILTALIFYLRMP